MMTSSSSFQLLVLFAMWLSLATPSMAKANTPGNCSSSRRLESDERVAVAAVDSAITTTCPIVNLTVANGGTANNSFYQCLETIFQCGEEGYIVKYLAYYSQTFYEKTRRRMSEPNGRAWVDKTLVCLQKSISSNILANSSCSDVWSVALAFHPPCYVDSGFCELSLRDKIAVFRTTRPLDPVREKGLRSLGGEIFRLCRKRRREKRDSQSSG